MRSDAGSCTQPPESVNFELGSQVVAVKEYLPTSDASVFGPQSVSSEDVHSRNALQVPANRLNKRAALAVSHETCSYVTEDDEPLGNKSAHPLQQLSAPPSVTTDHLSREVGFALPLADNDKEASVSTARRRTCLSASPPRPATSRKRRRSQDPRASSSASSAQLPAIRKSQSASSYQPHVVQEPIGWAMGSDDGSYGPDHYDTADGDHSTATTEPDDVDCCPVCDHAVSTAPAHNESSPCLRCNRWTRHHCGSDVSTPIALGSRDGFQVNQCTSILDLIRSRREARLHPEGAERIVAGRVCGVCARPSGGRHSSRAGQCPLWHRVCHTHCLSSQWHSRPRA